MAATRALLLSASVGMAALLVGVAASAASGETPLSAVSAPVTYADPAGDAGPAPDITSVAISDAADGVVTFQVTIGNQPSLAAGAFIFVNIDSDQNSTTGSSDHGGADRVFYLSDQGGFGALGWNGARYVRAPVASLIGSYANGVATFTFDRSDIGIGTGFNFYVISQVDASSNPASFDVVPDFGMLNYRLQSVPPPPLPLSLSVTDFTARGAKAGTTWIVGIEVTRSDTNQDLGAEGVITCSAAVGHTRLRARVHSFASGKVNGKTIRTALCGWHLPTTARGRTVTGTIVAHYRGAKASHTFTTKIR